MIKNILKTIPLFIVLSSCSALEWASDRTKSIFGMDDDKNERQESLANVPRRRVGEPMGGYGMPQQNMPVMPQPQFNNFNQPMGMGSMGNFPTMPMQPLMGNPSLPPVYNGQNMMPMQQPMNMNNPSMMQQGMYNSYGNPYAMPQNEWAAMPPPSNMISNISYTPGGLFPAAQAPGYGPVSPYVTNPVPVSYQAPQQLPQINYDDQLPSSPGIAYGPPAVGQVVETPLGAQSVSEDDSPDTPAIEYPASQPAGQPQYNIPPEANTNIQMQVPVVPVLEQQVQPVNQIEGLPPIDDQSSMQGYDPNKPMMDSGIPQMEPVDGYKQN